MEKHHAEVAERADRMHQLLRILRSAQEDDEREDHPRRSLFHRPPRAP